LEDEYANVFSRVAPELSEIPLIKNFRKYKSDFDCQNFCLFNSFKNMYTGICYLAPILEVKGGINIVVYKAFLG
jgi:hypothetical protein